MCVSALTWVTILVLGWLSRPVSVVKGWGISVSFVDSVRTSGWLLLCSILTLVVWLSFSVACGLASGKFRLTPNGCSSGSDSMCRSAVVLTCVR